MITFLNSIALMVGLITLLFSGNDFLLAGMVGMSIYVIALFVWVNTLPLYLSIPVMFTIAVFIKECILA